MTMPLIPDQAPQQRMRRMRRTRRTRRAEALAASCGRFRIAVLYAFGSRALEARAWLEGENLFAGASDLDVGVLPVAGGRLSARDRVELTIALEDLFQVPRVDLVVLPEARPFLASAVIQGERLFARNQDEADEYDLYVLRRAGDLLPFHRERVRMVLGAGA